MFQAPCFLEDCSASAVLLLAADASLPVLVPDFGVSGLEGAGKAVVGLANSVGLAPSRALAIACCAVDRRGTWGTCAALRWSWQVP